MTERERVICLDCGLQQQLPEVPPRRTAHCARCDSLLAHPAAGDLHRPLAFTLAALLLWLPACLAPLLTVSIAGTQREATLPGCARGLWSTGYPILAAVVGLLILAVPSAYLAMMVLVLNAARRGSGARGPQRLPWAHWPHRLLRAAGWLRPWLMTEVFVVGGCVAYTRIQTVATAKVQIGGWCLIGSALLLLAAAALVDERALRRRLTAASAPPAARALPTGPGADAVLGARHALPPSHALPAGAAQRKPRSMQRTTALVLAGLLLYVPANLLPILTIERYGSQQSSTILGGVRELIRNDLWPLAAIVFTASIVIPLAKLCGLSWMLWLTRRRSRRFLVGRTRTYRLIEAIGRWSNIDVFMISLLVALVQFGALTRVRAQSGAIAFAAVVIITMIASQSFDPRLMWDAVSGRGERQA